MFKFVFIAMLIAGSAFASDESTATDQVESVSLLDAMGVNWNKKPGKLDVEYRVGGGCRDHHPAAKVTIEPTTTGSLGIPVLRAKIEVLDISEGGPDHCRAFILVRGSIDLKQAIADAIKEQGFSKSHAHAPVLVVLPSFVMESPLY